ncbi:MAG: ROK family protein [Verrucomicrobia subdivision 3 bacterium]|nr:ROK family protein [Limisphaerales bacterium]
MGYALGIDLGGTSIKALAVTFEGKVLARENVPFDADVKLEWAEKIRQIASDLQAAREGPADCIGVSAPGLAARDGRSIAFMPGRLQGLEGLVWRDYLKTAFPVPVLNDAHAALLGEVWLGAARGFENVIMLTLGTGVGGAAMVDGRLLRGHIGRAGHLGHISLDPNGPPDCTGTPGSLEVAIGNETIGERSGGKFHTTHELMAAYNRGDQVAAQIWLASVKALAAAVCSFVNILDPEAAIIGGGIARAGDTLFKPLRQFLDKMEWQPGGQSVKLLPAELGEFAGATGAARNALTHAR